MGLACEAWNWRQAEGCWVPGREALASGAFGDDKFWKSKWGDVTNQKGSLTNQNDAKCGFIIIYPTKTVV